MTSSPNTEHRTPNTSSPRTLVLFGVPFHDVTFAEAIDWCVNRMKSGKPACLATANVDFLMQAARDPELQRILLEADLVIADGMPIVWASGKFGPRLRERVTGSDITPMLAAACAREGLSIYLLGGAPGVAEKAAEILLKRNPGLAIAGIYSPPLAGILDMNHAEILTRLREAKPHLLLVAFGAPKQEKFINLHQRDWNVPLAMGIGGTLDFLAGAQTRAPRWVQRVGFEWLWRLGTNPKRLFKRYASNIGFLASFWWRLNRLQRMPAGQPQDDTASDPWSALVEIPDRDRRFVSFALGGRNWLTSEDLGHLVQAAKILRRQNGRLLVHGGTPRIQRLLEVVGLADYLEYRSTTEMSLQRKRELEDARRLGRIARDENRLLVRLPSELSVATLSRWAANIDAAWTKQIESVEVDASEMEFLDSAGLGWLAAFRKRCIDEIVDFRSLGWQAAPRQTIRLGRMEKFFLE